MFEVGLANSRVVLQTTAYTKRLVARIEHTNRGTEYGLLSPATVRALVEVAK